MRVAARLGWDELEYGSPLSRAHAAGRLPDAWRPPDWRDLRRFALRSGMSRDFLADLLVEMHPGARRTWEAFGDPEALAVVTGQQPGCAGGILLTLYKAATAVALARRAARQLGRRVVPVFWNAADDTDFEEIARVAWPDRKRGLLFLELAVADRRAGARIGDLPATLDATAARSACLLLDEARRRNLESILPDSARDHADWVARLLQSVFPEIAVLDARSAALRRHGAPLFARFLERQAAARRDVEARRREIEASGFALTLSPETDWLGLFVIRDGVRRKAGSDVQALRETLAVAPENVSPNVVLRPLLQDTLLPVLAHVVGPSEIGYLLEMHPLRALLEVPQPALWLRLGMTALDEEEWRAALDLCIDPATLLRDPEAALGAAAARRVGDESQEIGAVFAALEGRLDGLEHPALRAQMPRVRRSLAAVRGELLDRLAAAARQDLVKSEPALAALPATVRPRRRPQERVVAALWLLARWGGDSGARLLELAEAHLEALAAGRPEHAIVTL